MKPTGPPTCNSGLEDQTTEHLHRRDTHFCRQHYKMWPTAVQLHYTTVPQRYPFLQTALQNVADSSPATLHNCTAEIPTSADSTTKCGRQQSSYTPNSTTAGSNWRRRLHSSCTFAEWTVSVEAVEKKITDTFNICVLTSGSPSHTIIDVQRLRRSRQKCTFEANSK